MTGPEHLDRPAPTAIPQLLDHYRRQQDVLRKQTDEVARLREQVHLAAEREANDIIAAARGEIRRAIADARRDLLGLIAQVDALAHAEESAEEPPERGDVLRRTRQGLVEARQSVRELVEEARADLQSLVRRDSPAPPPSGEPSVAIGKPSDAVTAPNPAATEPSAAAAEPSRAPEPASQPTEGTASDTAVEPHRLRPKAVVACSVVGVGALIVVISQVASGRAARTEPPAAAIASALSPSSPRRAIDVKPQRTPSPAAAPNASALATPHPLSLVVAAQRTVWIKTTTDGRSDAGRTFQAGESRTVVADRDVSLRVGDAGAVAVALNGGSRRPLGRDGDAVTRRFAAGDTAAPMPRLSAGNASAAAEPIRPAAAPRAVATAGLQTTELARDDRPELTARAEQWLDAYYRRDPAGMASVSTRDATISDDRHADERPPAGLAIRRSLDGLTIQVAGDEAVLSGKMIEQAESGGQPQQRSSWISQMWTRQNGRWTLVDVRIRADGRLK